MAGFRWSHLGVIVYQESPGPIARSVGRPTRKSGPGFDTQSGHILSFLLPLIQEGQLSVTSESMCMKYWLTPKEV